MEDQNNIIQHSVQKYNNEEVKASQYIGRQVEGKGKAE